MINDGGSGCYGVGEGGHKQTMLGLISPGSRFRSCSHSNGKLLREILNRKTPISFQGKHLELSLHAVRQEVACQFGKMGWTKQIEMLCF
jgi:hypothetical protein